MRLIAIKATIEKPHHSIDILTNNGNKFASINKCGELTVFGEDMTLIHSELKKINVIADNFDLFFNNIKTL
jgi:hypothetical protein